MSKRTIFAANWKMHLGPQGADEFLNTFLKSYQARDDREVWLFPSAVALQAVSNRVADYPSISVGAQNIHWEPKGAFTGELATAMAKEAGALLALVGHSERRHVFGETDEETSRKLRALLEPDMVPLLCVGEKLEQREAGETMAVVERQLSVLAGLAPDALERVVVAYEPVWAIGTGKTATPEDAAVVHRAIRNWLDGHGLPAAVSRILYGGSVKAGNAHALLAQPDIDGVLVGGASLDPAAWSEIVATSLD